jgi:hypothetical protein
MNYRWIPDRGDAKSRNTIRGLITARRSLRKIGIGLNLMEGNMALKYSVISIAVQVAVFSVILSINVFAMEPLDMKRVTDADKIYFGSRLTPDQIEKLQQISIHGYTTSKSPCEKIVAINKTLHFFKAVTPVFREASTSNEISRYARKYSSSLAREFTETAEVFADILPRYKKICTDDKQKMARYRIMTTQSGV